jgi:hypothetical protein
MSFQPLAGFEAKGHLFVGFGEIHGEANLSRIEENTPNYSST